MLHEASIVQEWINEGMEKGRKVGKLEGKLEGEIETLRRDIQDVLEERFGRIKRGMGRSWPPSTIRRYCASFLERA